MAPVSIFNANTQGVSIMVNNGTRYSLAGASSGSHFAPTLLSGSNLTYSESAAEPDKFGPGPNVVFMTLAGGNQLGMFTVNITAQQQIISLQLYMFWASANSVSYVLLNNGQLITQQSVAVSGI